MYRVAPINSLNVYTTEAQNHTDGELQSHTEHWVLALLMTLVQLSAEAGGLQNWPQSLIPGVSIL